MGPGLKNQFSIDHLCLLVPKKVSPQALAKLLTIFVGLVGLIYAAGEDSFSRSKTANLFAVSLVLH